MQVNRALREVADRQWGYFSTRQAINAGYTNELQRYHHRSGNWQRVDRALFRLPGYPDTPEGELIRWTLWAAGQSDTRLVVVSHQSALHFYGLQPEPPAAVHLTVSSLRHRAENSGCVLHWEALEPIDYLAKECFNVTTPLKTLRALQPDLTLEGRWTGTVCLAYERGLLAEREQAQLLGVQAAASAAVPACYESGMPALSGGEGVGLHELARQVSLRGYARSGWSAAGRSFTLIEMLVVIAIISILAAMLMPALQNAIESGRQTGCTNNQKQVGMAISMYADQYNDYIPAVVTDTVGWSDYWDTTRIWAMVYPQGWGQTAFRNSIFACPTYLAEKPTTGVSYALNGWYPSGSQDVLKPHKRSMATYPSRCLLLGEGANRFINGWSYNPGPPAGQPPLFPHKDKMTITFMDGHGSSIYGIDIPTSTSSVFWKGR